MEIKWHLQKEGQSMSKMSQAMPVPMPTRTTTKTRPSVIHQTTALKPSAKVPMMPAMLLHQKLAVLKVRARTTMTVQRHPLPHLPPLVRRRRFPAECTMLPSSTTSESVPITWRPSTPGLMRLIVGPMPVVASRRAERAITSLRLTTTKRMMAPTPATIAIAMVTSATMTRPWSWKTNKMNRYLHQRVRSRRSGCTRALPMLFRRNEDLATTDRPSFRPTRPGH
mmetsp:Transcript_5422/g.12988  ORF Transcript_5422/g.12988 Transcript_5422/m.12988 type:complete len:224 (-) Transcript_5422:13-684(-)